MVVTFRYKQCYAARVEQLTAIPIWKRQRVYNSDRVKKIATDKAKSTQPGLPGIISLYELGDGEHGVVDGQHRVGALALLLERGAWSADATVLVEVSTPPTSNQSRPNTL